MLLKIAIVVVVLILVVLSYAASKSDTLSVRRSIVINAPPQKIFALIDDFHNWHRWAPQDREDPTMQRTFSGLQKGAGAISSWNGSGSTGKGTMTIEAAEPFTTVVVEVRFERPFAAQNQNEFTLEPAGNATRVTWTIHAQNLYMMKLMGVFTNMDTMMGKHFESGLKDLKIVAED
jgi:uncharacterized protein YndB with AHSA1/START domain